MSECVPYPTRSDSAGDRSNRVDQHIGSRLRSRRQALSLDEEVVGQLAGCSGAAVERFELGIECIGARTLYEFSRILRVPIAFFFSGFTRGTAL